ncbi:MAG: AAA family ATPase [Actinomycetota bacterium]|nr:AAA family ATPase [Actinomycetota bacterium]
MIIKRIQLRRFKKFKTLEMGFSPGINVIKGPNEAGKSTLHTAIIAGLFFNPHHTRAEIKGCLSWGSDRMYEIGMEVKEDNSSYILRKDFETKKIHLSGSDLREEIVDPARVAGKVREWLGLSSATAFKSTACIQQDKISQIAKGEKEIGDSLQAIITGEDEASASSALDKLRKATANLTKGLERVTRYPGEIQRTMALIDELNGEREGLQQEVNEVKNASTRLFGVEQELEKVVSEFSTKVNLKEKNEKRQKLRKELGDIEHRYQEIQRAFGIAKDIEELDAELVPYSSFFDIQDEDMGAFHTLLGNKQSYEQTRESLQKQLEQPLPTPPVEPEPEPASRYLLIVGAVLLVLGIVGAFFSRFMPILAVVGLGLAGYGLLKARPPRPIDPAFLFERMKGQLARIETELLGVEQNIKYFLSRTGCETSTACLEEYEKYKPLRAKKAAKKSELTGILGEKNLKDLEIESRALALDRNAKKEEWESLESIALEPEQFQRLLEEIGVLTERKERLSDEKKELEITISKARATPEDIAAIEERLSDLEQRLAFFERRRKIYELTFEVLDKARKASWRAATKVLEEEIAKHISRVTDGRYESAKVDEETLSFFVYSPEKENYVKAEELSRATIDQIYLAARLGLVRLITGDKKSPLLFDDPFVTFDDKRLESTMKMVKEISKEYQILLFTCENKYDVYADKVLDLTKIDVAPAQTSLLI